MNDDALLDVVLAPNPPLPPRGFYVIVGGIAALSFVAGVIFVLKGAWPVTPFFGADVLLLFWAFRKCAYAARRREHVRITHDELVIERIAADGRTRLERVNPYWLRVEHEDAERVGCELALVSRGRRWILGSFLGAEERASLADALRAALYRVRHTFPRVLAADQAESPKTSFME